MSNINYSLILKNQIRFLENEQVIKEQLLKEQLHYLYKSLNPLNLLLSTIKDFSSSPNMLENMLGTVVGMASGYLSKKIVIGRSANIFRKLIGSVLQLGVTNVVAQHPDSIESIGQFILHKIFSKKETKSLQSER